MIYTWDSRTPADDLTSMINGLSISSSYSVSWEIEILLKFAKMQKQNSSLSQGRNQQTKAKSSASYFIRQPDIGVCCVVSKSKDMINDDVYVCTDADIEEKYSNYIHRSLWRASGQRFCIGASLISVGFIEHSGSAVKPCIEISYCPVDDDEPKARTEEELTSIAYQIHKVAIDLLAAYTGPVTIPILTTEKKDTPSSSILVTTVGMRAIQWLSLVAH